MGHTYTSLMYHGVFSTKHRRELLGPTVMPELVKGNLLERHGLEYDRRYVFD
ncbi:MAG TPA: hypothetical protein VFJ30_13655 [Phycisphaerae bacterium]|nr:hypothetical protein [Phycisphaerae bacterium]